MCNDTGKESKFDDPSSKLLSSPVPLMNFQVSTSRSQILLLLSGWTGRRTRQQHEGPPSPSSSKQARSSNLLGVVRYTNGTSTSRHGLLPGFQRRRWDSAVHADRRKFRTTRNRHQLQYAGRDIKHINTPFAVGRLRGVSQVIPERSTPNPTGGRARGPLLMLQESKRLLTSTRGPQSI